MTEEFGYGVFTSDLDRFLELERLYAEKYPSAASRVITSLLNQDIGSGRINHKRCCVCKKVKSVGDYYKDSSKVAGYEANCKACKLPVKMSKQGMYTKYKTGSVKRNIDFDLDKETFIKLIQSPCHYCGKKVKCELDTSSFNGVDRVENDKGYHKDNVVPCCSTCNFAKHTLPQQEFIDMCVRVANHQKEKSNLPKRHTKYDTKDVEKVWINKIEKGKIKQEDFDYPVW